MRKVIMISAEPRGRRDWVWVVYRNRYPEQERGFIKSILGIGDEYNKIETFEGREEAVDYGIDIAEPDGKVTLSKKHGAQMTVREASEVSRRSSKRAYSEDSADR